MLGYSGHQLRPREPGNKVIHQAMERCSFCARMFDLLITLYLRAASNSRAWCRLHRDVGIGLSTLLRIKATLDVAKIDS